MSETIDDVRSKLSFLNGLNAREYASIHLRVEHPDCPAWLNKMIRASRRDELARHLAVMCVRKEETIFDVAWRTYEFADAILKEGEK